MKGWCFLQVSRCVVHKSDATSWQNTIANANDALLFPICKNFHNNPISNIRNHVHYAASNQTCKDHLLFMLFLLDNPLTGLGGSAHSVPCPQTSHTALPSSADLVS